MIPDRRRIPMKKKRTACIPVFMIMVFLLVTPSVSAQGKEYRLNEEFLNNFQRDFVSVCTSFSKWKQKDLLTFAAVFGTGLLLYSVDGDIHEWSQEQQNYSSKKLAGFYSDVGHGAVLGGLSAALYLSGELFDNGKLRKIGLLSLESLGTAAVIVLSIKFITGRARPRSGESRDTFRPFSTAARFSSFPSGHSSAAFAVATVIACESDNAFVDFLSYSTASLVALSRVHTDNHWASDVFIGSAIGYFVGKRISSLHKDRKKGNLRIGMKWSLNSPGFTISYSF